MAEKCASTFQLQCIQFEGNLNAEKKVQLDVSGRRKTMV